MAFYNQLTVTSTVLTAFMVLLSAFLFQKTLVSISAFGITDPFAYFPFSYTAHLTSADLSKVRSDPSCTILHSQFSSIVHLPGEEEYVTPINTYWSAKAQAVLPSCVVKPMNVDQLSEVIRELKNLYDSQSKGDKKQSEKNTSRVRFAVRSGGHMPEVEFATIDSGVLIDLREFNGVSVASDRKTATIGVGTRWGSVYKELETVGLTVAGGRDSDVGVGGLSLGGGISFLSPRVGLVSDNILEYEVVLASGEIITATETQHPDIWRALKGGGGNFGIVTKITARAFPSGPIWGGYLYWPPGQAKKLFRELHEFVKPERFDPYAAGPILAHGYVKMFGIGMHGIVSSVVYTKPEAWPPVWKGFQNVKRMWSTVKVQSMSDVSDEMTSMAPSGKRQFMNTLTIQNDLETIEGLFEIYKKSLEKIKHVSGVGRGIVYQPLTPTIINKGTPNVVGLNTRNVSEPRIIIFVTQAWQLEQDDELIESTTRELMAGLRAYAQEKGTLDPFIYLNYASIDQDVFSSYGEDDRRFLKKVSRKFDPDGFWQHAKEGGHKLKFD